jgi:hypothetical protein
MSSTQVKAETDIQLARIEIVSFLRKGISLLGVQTFEMCFTKSRIETPVQLFLNNIVQGDMCHNKIAIDGKTLLGKYRPLTFD